MIFIVVKFTVKEQYVDQWLGLTASFTDGTRREPGNLWFEWNVSVDNPAEYVLIEAFDDSQAGSEHVASSHFREGLATMQPLLSRTPRIVHTVIDQQDWSLMGELRVESDQAAAAPQ